MALWMTQFSSLHFAVEKGKEKRKTDNGGWMSNDQVSFGSRAIQRRHVDPYDTRYTSLK